MTTDIGSVVYFEMISQLSCKLLAYQTHSWKLPHSAPLFEENLLRTTVVKCFKEFLKFNSIKYLSSVLKKHVLSDNVSSDIMEKLESTKNCGLFKEFVLACGYV